MISITVTVFYGNSSIGVVNDTALHYPPPYPPSLYIYIYLSLSAEKYYDSKYEIYQLDTSINSVVAFLTLSRYSLYTALGSFLQM